MFNFNYVHVIVILLRLHYHYRIVTILSRLRSCNSYPSGKLLLSVSINLSMIIIAL